MRKFYREPLQELNQGMTQLGADCAELIALSARAMPRDRRDAQARELVTKIKQSCQSIEAICRKLLLARQLAGSDLQKVSTAMKMVMDLENIRDQAQEILKRVPGEKRDADPRIQKMAEAAQSLLTQAVAAFVRQDLSLASAVADCGEAVGDCFDGIWEDVLSSLSADPGEGGPALELMTIARSFQRIVEHCVDLAEWTAFPLTESRESVPCNFMEKGLLYNVY